MAAQGPHEMLSTWTYEELFKRHTLELSNFCSKSVATFCAALALKVESVDTLVFAEMLITIATVSPRCVAQVPGEAVETHANMILVVTAPTSSGKTAAYKPFALVRERRFELSGIPTDASYGTEMGAIGSIAAVTKGGGAALLTADEGLDELIKFLSDCKNNNSLGGAPAAAGGQQFGGARALNMLYSGTSYRRAYTTKPDVIIPNCYLSVMATGTPVHFDRFRDLFSVRGGQDGFRTRVLTLFSKKQYAAFKGGPESVRSEEGEAIFGCTAAQLMQLFQDAFFHLAQWFEGGGCEPLVFSPAACIVLAAKKREIVLRATAEGSVGEEETPGQSWRRLTKTPAPNQPVPDERLIEQTKKVAISLHLLETVFTWLDFATLQLQARPFVATVSAVTVRAALAFVERCRTQEQFYERMMKHCSGAITSRQRVVPEHADIVLYNALTTRLLLWPGPVVTWESAVDRYRHWFLSLSFDECMEAIDTLTEYGCTTRNESKRFETGGAKVLIDDHSRSFRFYKTPPALIEPAFLQRYGVHMEDYKARFEMEYMQIKAAHCWTRSQQEWKEILKRTPSWLSRKRRQDELDTAASLETNLDFFSLVKKQQRIARVCETATAAQRQHISAVMRAIATVPAPTPALPSVFH